METEVLPSLLTWFYATALAAAVTVTAFPLLYSLGPWYKDALGRALMAKAIAFALIIDLTVLFLFWRPSSLTVLVTINVIAFGLVALATGYLTWMLWKHNFIRPEKENRMRSRSAYQAAQRENKPLVSDTLYKFMRRLVEYILPASGALYFTLSEIWGLPHAAEVVGTITAVATFLGVCVHITRKSYDESDAKYDGELVVDTSDPERDIFQVDLGEDLPELSKKDEITLKVKSV